MRAGRRRFLLGPRPTMLFPLPIVVWHPKTLKSFESNILNGGIPRTESPIHHCFHASRTPMRGKAPIFRNTVELTIKNNANDIVALFQCVCASTSSVFFSAFTNMVQLFHEYLLKIHQKILSQSLFHQTPTRKVALFNCCLDFINENCQLGLCCFYLQTLEFLVEQATWGGNPRE